MGCFVGLFVGLLVACYFRLLVVWFGVGLAACLVLSRLRCFAWCVGSHSFCVSGL